MLSNSPKIWPVEYNPEQASVIIEIPGKIFEDLPYTSAELVEYFQVGNIEILENPLRLLVYKNFNSEEENQQNQELTELIDRIKKMIAPLKNGKTKWTIKIKKPPNKNTTIENTDILTTLFRNASKNVID